MVYTKARLFALGILACIGLMMAAPMVRAEVRGNLIDLAQDGKVMAGVQSVGQWDRVKTVLINLTAEDLSVTIPYGTLFRSKDSAYLDYALLGNLSIPVPASKAVEVVFEVACLRGSGRVAPSGYQDWLVKFEQDLSNLMTFFYTGELMLGGVLSAEYTRDGTKKHEFMQVLLLHYAGASKDEINDFAAAYMFTKKAEARNWVDMTLPLAKNVLDMYKMLNGVGGGK